MKKARRALLSLFLVVTLLMVSCTKTPPVDNQMDAILDKLTLTYATGDTKDKVTRDFDLPDTLDTAKITWASSDAAVIAINNNKAVITRHSENKTVTLTATITINDNSKTKEFVVVVFAKEAVVVTQYTITWVVDGVSSTTKVDQGVMPTKDAPTKEGYTFKGWQPQIVVASADATYSAVFEKTSVTPPKESLEDQVNKLVGRDVCSKLPKITTNDFEVLTEELEQYPIYVSVDIYDWDEASANSYMDALDQLLEFDEKEESWIYEDLFVVVYVNETVTGNTYYGIAIYKPEEDSDKPVEPVDPEGEQTAVITSNHATSETNSIPDGIINSHLNINNTGSATFEVSFAKNSSTVSNIFNNSSGEIRLYPGSGNGGQLSIQINSDFEIVSISIVVGGNSGFSINNSVFKSESSATIVHDFEDAVSLVELKNTANATKKNRVDIKEITITYRATENGGTTEPQEPLEEGETALLDDNMLNLNDWQLTLESKHSGVPSIGEFNILVIPVEVKGVPFDDNYLQKLDLVFNGNNATTGWQSVSSYYQLSSYGKLNITFDIHEKYSLSNNKAYYESMEGAPDEEAIIEALKGVDRTKDFSIYDYNNDGLIDGVIFVYSVKYSNPDEPWWAWVFDAEFFERHQAPNVDGLNLGYYMWVSYNFINDELTVDVEVNAETFIHEMGHMLGQTDLYSYDKYLGPLGGWDMMDYNSGDHGPFNKLLWGWTSPLIANPGYKYQITLDSYATDTDGIDSVILIPRSNADFTDRNVFDEYLLVIFYTPKGLYDAHKNSSIGIDSAGVLVYRIDARLAEELSFWNFFLNNNDGNGNFLIEILEADKNNSLTSGDGGIEVSDFLREGTLDLSSYRWNQGGKINVSITINSPITNDSSNASLTIGVN